MVNNFMFKHTTNLKTPKVITSVFLRSKYFSIGKNCDCKDLRKCMLYNFTNTSSLVLSSTIKKLVDQHEVVFDIFLGNFAEVWLHHLYHLKQKFEHHRSINILLRHGCQPNVRPLKLELTKFLNNCKIDSTGIVQNIVNMSSRQAV